MRRKIKKYEYECDLCGVKEVVETTGYPWLPEKWSNVEVHDCGSTGYSNAYDVCPKCTKKSRKDKP